VKRKNRQRIKFTVAGGENLARQRQSNSPEQVGGQQRKLETVLRRVRQVCYQKKEAL